MLISDMIEGLETMQRLHGNVPVFARGKDGKFAECEETPCDPTSLDMDIDFETAIYMLTREDFPE